METVINEIKKRHKAGQSLNSKYAYKTDRPLYMMAIKRYKNWSTGVSSADIDYGKVRLRRMMSKAEIKKEILELYNRSVELTFPNMREKHLYLLAAHSRNLSTKI